MHIPRYSRSLSSTQEFPPYPENIDIKQCIQCAKQFDKCTCTNKCTACFNIECTCSTKCNGCLKSFSQSSNFEIINQDYCMCNLASHMAIKQELQGQIEDEVSINMQSDIEQSLEERLKDFDIDLENPNFNLPNEEINITHITDKAINVKLKSVLESYDGVFSTSKFDVGHCHLINTKIPLTSSTIKHWEPERKIRPEEFQQVDKLISELLKYGIIAEADQTTRFCSNILTVPKPSDGEDPSKAAQNIRKHQNKARENTRVVIDLRGINKATVPLPPIALSSYKELQKEFKTHTCPLLT